MLRQRLQLVATEIQHGVVDSREVCVQTVGGQHERMIQMHQTQVTVSFVDHFLLQKPQEIVDLAVAVERVAGQNDLGQLVFVGMSAYHVALVFSDHLQAAHVESRDVVERQIDSENALDQVELQVFRLQKEQSL
ncbi:hypothetical protein LSTR_LSTR016971 [Laodelphax striatellus]|uniref:Uncharacterized protein n=1 Tax=Laodelphax striatellus TaxID=195883 RepID=A0A482WXQ3_LAOST|nr:hypothetical protein LSTR_LSTR016971 [Laodelphax striatellus]